MKSEPIKGDIVVLESAPGSKSLVNYKYDGDRWTFIDTNGRLQREVLNRSKDITEYFMTGVITREFIKSEWK